MIENRRDSSNWQVLIRHTRRKRWVPAHASTKTPVEGMCPPNVAERGRDILVGQRKLVSGTKTFDNSFEGGDASPPQFSWRKPSMSEAGTRKRKRAGWILMTTSFLCSTVVFFSLYLLHHFLLDLLVGIFSAALMLLCLVMFILKKP
jgi:hypothetical protein